MLNELWLEKLAFAAAIALFCAGVSASPPAAAAEGRPRRIEADAAKRAEDARQRRETDGAASGAREVGRKYDLTKKAEGNAADINALAAKTAERQAAQQQAQRDAARVAEASRMNQKVRDARTVDRGSNLTPSNTPNANTSGGGGSGRGKAPGK
jgi:regulator of protease activity HflC (stomatin/prohibitin superfamily)